MLSCEFCETVKDTIFTEHLRIPALVFMKYIWQYFLGNVIKLNVNWPEWLFQHSEYS